MNKEGKRYDSVTVEDSVFICMVTQKTYELGISDCALERMTKLAGLTAQLSFIRQGKRKGFSFWKAMRIAHALGISLQDLQDECRKGRKIGISNGVKKKFHSKETP